MHLLNIKTYIFLFLAFFSLNAQNYLWPTNASRALSSGFCEYRPGHYHSAIDIKTWNREGYPVYAVSNGRIFKIHVSPFGYGKVLYLKLDDGRFAVYAHLQRFTKAIEAEIRKVQIQKKRYSVTWRPKQWRVKKGETLAFTGQTGIGVPHLHFEIRDSAGHPLNPLAFYPPVEDHKPPTIQSLLLLPRTPGTMVGHSFLPKKIQLKPLAGDTLQPAQPITARGIVGLAVRGYDQSDKVYNKYGFYRSTLWVNGRKVFHIQYDTLDFDLTGQVDLDIDYPTYKTTHQRFHKLFIEPFNQLPFYDRSLGNDLLRVENAPLPFLIEISDFYGNTRFIKGTIAPQTPAPLQITMARRVDDAFFLEWKLPNGLKTLSFRERTPQGQKTIERFEILRQIFNDDNQNMLFRLQPDSLASELTLKVELKNGDTLSSRLSLEQNSDENPTFDFYPFGTFWVARIAPVPFLPALTLNVRRGHLTENLTQLRKGSSLQALLPARLFEGERPVTLRLQSGQQTLADTVQDVHVLIPGEKKRWHFAQDRVALESIPHSVYDSLLFTATEVIPDTVQNTVPLFSPAFRIWGQQQKFRSGLILKMTPDSVPPNPKQVGICRLSSRGKLSWSAAQYESSANRFSRSIASFGTYILAADTTAPQIAITLPRSGKLYHKTPLIEFLATDSLAGIGSDRNIQVFVDGRFVIPEWDPERELVRVRPYWKVAPGKHRVRVLVRDRAGNETEKIRTFRLAGNQP